MGDQSPFGWGKRACNVKWPREHNWRQRGYATKDYLRWILLCLDKHETVITPQLEADFIELLRDDGFRDGLQQKALYHLHHGNKGTPVQAYWYTEEMRLEDARKTAERERLKMEKEEAEMRERMLFEERE